MASQLVVTWGPHKQIDRQTWLKTLPSYTILQAVRNTAFPFEEWLQHSDVIGRAFCNQGTMTKLDQWEKIFFTQYIKLTWSAYYTCGLLNSNELQECKGDDDYSLYSCKSHGLKYLEIETKILHLFSRLLYIITCCRKQYQVRHGHLKRKINKKAKGLHLWLCVRRLGKISIAIRNGFSYLFINYSPEFYDIIEECHLWCFI